MTAPGEVPATGSNDGLPQLLAASLRTVRRAYLVPVAFASLVAVGEYTSHFVSVLGLVVLYVALLPYVHWARGGDVELDDGLLVYLVFASIIAYFVLNVLLNFAVGGLRAMVGGEQFSELWMILAGLFILAGMAFIAARIVLFFPAFLLGGNPIEAARYIYTRPIPETVVVGAYFLVALLLGGVVEHLTHLVAPFPVGRLAAMAVFSTLATVGSVVAYDRFDDDAKSIFVR